MGSFFVVRLISEARDTDNVGSSLLILLLRSQTTLAEFCSLSATTSHPQPVFLHIKRCVSHYKERNDAVCSKWRHLEIVMLSEVSQTQERYHMTSFIFGIQKKHDTNKLIYKTVSQTYRIQGEGWG